MLLAASCLGTGAVLLGGRALLRGLPSATPASTAVELERMRRWSPDPVRRREASLLLEARAQARRDPRDRRRLLRSQGWGADPLAALVLKHDALAAGKLDLDDRAGELWQDLLHRFPTDPAAADALYALGRDRPELRRELRQRFPAHPAALAAALEAGPAPAERLSGALHLARWGARWPGARERFQELCGSQVGGITPPQRVQLAQGLAELGAAEAALDCLGVAGKGGVDSPSPPSAAAVLPPALTALSPPARLDLARALLGGQPSRKRLAESMLVQLARQMPQSPEAEEAVRLLSEQQGAEVTATLRLLPARWQDSAPVAAHRIRALSEGKAAGSGPAGSPGGPSPEAAGLEVLRRWPTDPASWDLQWFLARKALLAGRWAQADAILSAIDPEGLPPPLAARHRFWQGYGQRQLGRDEAATATWRRLRLHHPGGYYGWRAAVQLGEGDLKLTPGAHGTGPAALTSEPWQPLTSGDASLDRLWRIDQRTEAWETWRTRRGGRRPQGSAELLLEGRMRQGVGDDWTGFAQLEQAGLRLKPEQCALLPQIERSLHPPRFMGAFTPVASQEKLPIELLLGLAKQESRFTPSVRSSAGAVGLMQLLPSTAAEVAGAPVSDADLLDPSRNAELGGRYLRGLMRRWLGNPLLAVASYNAGPGAVADWVDPRLQAAPELWVEAIPFPETRLYVKKVLGNAWSYQRAERPRC